MKRIEVPKLVLSDGDFSNSAEYTFITNSMLNQALQHPPMEDFKRTPREQTTPIMQEERKGAGTHRSSDS